MINQRDRDIVEREVNKMVERSQINPVILHWEEMKVTFWTPFADSRRCVVPISGDTVEEIIEAIRLDVNQILQDMIDTLEASKLDYKYGKRGVTV